jgi:hypothetical protein
MKKLLFIVVVLLSSFYSVAQNVEGLYSFFDYPISTIIIQTDISHINTFVRRVDADDETQYYYVFKVVSKDTRASMQSSFVTMISYEDLKKINCALKLLLVKEEDDRKLELAKVDYIENKYVTESGFKIGYCIDNAKLEWFVDFDHVGAINGWNLEDRVNDFIDTKTFIIYNCNGTEIKESFDKAQAKIDSLMQQKNVQ